MPPPETPRVGYVLKMYPRFSETFIVTEVLAHEAAGLDLSIFSLRLPIDGRFHEALAAVRAPVTYLLADSVRSVDYWAGLSHAGRAVPGLWEALRNETHADGHEVLQAALLAEQVVARGITHLHAHFATSSATVAMLAAAAAGITFSFTAHAKDIYTDEVDPALLRRKLRAASTAITVSDYNLRHLRAAFGSDAGRVRRIYNGLDLNEFAYEAPENRPRVIVGVGRMIEKKGFEYLIDACGLLRRRGVEFRCEMIGDGPLVPALTSRAAELGLGDAVEFLGGRPRGEVIRRVRAAGVLAAPCVVGRDGNRDGLPTVLLEAMALGTPCVSTDVTGIPEIVRHGQTGLLVPQHDAAALADALGTLLADGDRRCSLTARARALMEERFDIHANAAQIRALFGAGHAAPTPQESGAAP